MKKVSEIRNDDYFDKQEYGKEGSCAICGRALNIRPDKWVHLHRGGTHIIKEGEEEELDDAGDLGFFPVGPTCAEQNDHLEEYYHEL